MNYIRIPLWLHQYEKITLCCLFQKSPSSSIPNLGPSFPHAGIHYSNSIIISPFIYSFVAQLCMSNC